MARKTELLYMKLCHQLMSDYENKPYYSPLPGERELCEIYKVSRPTVRKALEVLENEGCIARFAGKGAFFIGNKQEESEDENSVSTNIAFYNQVRLRGDYTRSKVLSQKLPMKRWPKHFRLARETGYFIWKDCVISTKNYGLFLMHILHMKNVQS